MDTLVSSQRFAAVGLVLLAVGMRPASANENADYDSHVKPILVEKCYECHGPSEKKGGLRLTNGEDAVRGGKSGKAAYIAGEAASSLLIVRVASADPDYRMPPKGDPLTAVEIDILTRWINDGADWSEAGRSEVLHWAYNPPEQVPLPRVEQTDWPRNPLDRFILSRINSEGLSPSPEADRRTLIRRLSLDLTGLPPAPDEVHAFVDDSRPDAYEWLVERLLASPHYGERQAIQWLDIARYADTNGYEKDRPRSIWPYRDWVINAFNKDMPYDRFIIEQLAGDLLPNATQDQRIATGFLRNSMINEEGGIDFEEFRYEAMVDRTNTTSTAFLGLTLGCAQCHDHKFDPLSQREYFGLYAFLNNTDDAVMEVRTPKLEQERAEIQAKIDALVAGLESAFPGSEPSTEAPDEERAAHLARKLTAWETGTAQYANHWTVLNPLDCVSKGNATFVKLDDLSLLAKGDNPNLDTYEVKLRTDIDNITALRIEALPHPSLPNGGPGRGVIMSNGGDFLLSEIAVTTAPWSNPNDSRPVTLQNPTQDYAAEGRTADLSLDGKLDTGWSVKGEEGKPHSAVFEFAEPVSFDGGTLLRIQLDQYYVHQHTLGRFRISVTSDPLPVRDAGVTADLEEALTMAAGERSDEQQRLLKQHFLTITPELSEQRAEIAALRANMPAFPQSLILEERTEPRVTRMHHRGEYLSPTEVVTPGVPAVLPELPGEAPLNRLTLAQWLADEDNPLTARVMVNRVWQQFFGRGIAASVDDFGVRGDLPSQPELLDWLAVEFMQRGWSTKELARLIVTSAAYRQSSAVTPELAEIDPDNELMARGPRYRVDAELVRDIALAASGLLDGEVGGPSVFPPMPAGMQALTFGGLQWPESEGRDRYRRGIYTYIKRTLPYPTLTVFDAPARDTTCTRRIRSNTPLQALTLLNDAVFMEAARALAKRVLTEGPAEQAERVRFAFETVLGRGPDPQELQWLTEYCESQRERFAQGELDPATLTGDIDATLDPAEFAAWTLASRILLNLDETVTKS